MSKLLICLATTLMLAFPTMASELSKTSVDGAETITSDRAAELFDAGAVFVDVRKVGPYEEGRIPGAIHLDLKLAFTEDALAAVAGKSDDLVIYCNGPYCPRAAAGCEKALSWGYTNVYYYRDGLPGWEAAGLPVE